MQEMPKRYFLSLSASASAEYAINIAASTRRCTSRLFSSFCLSCMKRWTRAAGRFEVWAFFTLCWMQPGLVRGIPVIATHIWHDMVMGAWQVQHVIYRTTQGLSPTVDGMPKGFW
ncbi:hypothetical protein V8C35DRAFT_287343 [Trichoderma chlorosporum]